MIRLRNFLFAFICGDILFFLFPFPPAVWRALIILTSLVIIFKYGNGIKWDGTQKCSVIIILMVAFHFFISHLWSSPAYTVLINTIVTLSGFISFGILGKKEALSDKFMVWAMCILVVLAIPYYYNFLNIISEVKGLDADNATNNASVLFLWILPLTVALSKKKSSIFVVGICVFYLLLASKRSNIIAGAIVLIIYVYMIFRDKDTRLLYKVMMLLGIVAVAILAYKWAMSNDYLMKRYYDTMEGNSSGRDAIYMGYWNMWTGSDSLIHTLFGWGYNGTGLSSIHSMAHNDWLEFLIDYGLIGVVILFAFVMSFFNRSRKANNPTSKLVLLSIFLVFLVKTSFSMCVVDDYTIIISISYGYALQMNKCHQMCD